MPCGGLPVSLPDALTVVAVVISVAVGFYGIYHRVASSRPGEDLQDDSHVDAHNREVLEQFRAFLRSLMMHAGVGTARGRDDDGGRAAKPDHCESGGLALR